MFTRSETRITSASLAFLVAGASFAILLAAVRPRTPALGSEHAT